MPEVFGAAAFSRPAIRPARPLSPPIAGEVPRPSTGSHYALVEATRSMTERKWGTDFPLQIERHLRIFLERARAIPDHAFETILDLFAVIVLASPFASSGSPVAGLLADTSSPLLRILLHAGRVVLWRVLDPAIAHGRGRNEQLELSFRGVRRSAGAGPTGGGRGRVGAAGASAADKRP